MSSLKHALIATLLITIAGLGAARTHGGLEPVLGVDAGWEGEEDECPECEVSHRVGLGGEGRAPVWGTVGGGRRMRGHRRVDRARPRLDEHLKYL